MQIRVMVKDFLYTRKHGLEGARKKCSQNTLDLYVRNLETFRKCMEEDGGVSDFALVKRGTVRLFIEMLDTKKAAGEWSEATRLQILRCVRTFLIWVDESEDCQAADIAGWRKMKRWFPVIQPTPQRNDIPAASIMKKWLASFSLRTVWGYRDYTAACILLDTGIRIGELSNLMLGDLHLDERVMVVTGKQGSRPVALSKLASRITRTWLKKRKDCTHADNSEYVFVGQRGPKTTVSGWIQRMRRHRNKHSLPRITAHTCRHVFSTNFLRKGGDMEKLRLMTGHTSYETLRKYLHLAEVGGDMMQQVQDRVTLLGD